MLFVYNLLTYITGAVLHIVALFSPKMKLFVNGRKTVFATLKENIQPTDKVLWFHAASLGEFEMGLPVMEQMRAEYQQYKILLTFFSPSGYEIRKNTPAADVVVYLPLDTKANARRFLKLAHPDMAFFIKYEFWPNYLNELRKRNTETYLISGLFREKQAFFKWYGGFYREALKAFCHFFVQYDSSKQLLQSIGFNNATVTGDTRYDRVSKILERDNSLPFMENFISGKLAAVYGSSWPKDESNFRPFVEQHPDVKHIIAPHDISGEHISQLQHMFPGALLYSEMEGKDLNAHNVFIINTIGLLGKIYSYADMAYVGGGFGTAGLHNILEPAAFGVPIVIGPNHEKFPEAAALIHFGGCIEARGGETLVDTLNELAHNDDYRHETGYKAGTFVSMNRGAVDTIMKKITADGNL